MTASLQNQAAKALQGGDYAKAFSCYQQLREISDTQGAAGSETVYLNGGACLRSLKRQQEAAQWLHEGLKHYPFSAGMHKNLANNLIDLKDNRWRALFHYLMAYRLGSVDQGLILSLSAILHELNFPLAAYHLLYGWWQNAQQEQKEAPSPDMVRILLELGLTLFDEEELEPVASWCLQQLERDKPISTAPERLAMAGVCIRRGEIAEGLRHYRQVQDDVAAGRLADSQLFINASWNLACSLLKRGEMALGWDLYEFGLRAPAKGPQRWQRALPKLFKASEVPVWRGQELEPGSRLLLLGEQGIGDSMMFLQLLPVLLKRSLTLTLALPERLVSTYTRTFPKLRILTGEQAEAQLQASDLDWQCPVGSLPRHLLAPWVEQDCPQVLLQPPGPLKTKFRREHRRGLAKGKPVIGISWSGGATRERNRVKSLKPDDVAGMMKRIDARFVSLQYGNCAKQVAKWRDQGIDILHNPDVNPLVDMDTWMAQVAACDLVISVANTTIHGAGLVGVPTLCLLSRSADWRWVDGIDGSYWYDCVDSTRQERNGSWNQALTMAVEWCSHRMQDPKGDGMQTSARSRCEQLSFREWT